MKSVTSRTINIIAGRLSGNRATVTHEDADSVRATVQVHGADKVSEVTIVLPRRSKSGIQYFEETTATIDTIGAKRTAFLRT